MKERDKAIRQFVAHLRIKNLRLTKEREDVLRAALGMESHFDPEELHLRTREAGSRVSRASVYRTIPLLVESGVIEQVENTDKHAHYEVVAGRAHHDHMLCTACGRVIEFYCEELESLQGRLCERHGFRGDTHTLEIRGLCGGCASASG